MADLEEAWRQAVPTEAAQELLQRQPHGWELALVGVVLVAEAQRAVLLVQNLPAAISKGDSVGVAVQLCPHGLRAGKRLLGVADPLGTTERAQPAIEDGRLVQARFGAGKLQLARIEELLQAVAKLCAEDLPTAPAPGTAPWGRWAPRIEHPEPNQPLLAHVAACKLVRNLSLEACHRRRGC